MGHAICDAVAATGREINEPTHQDAVKLGYVSTLKHLHSRGRLRYKVNLCEAAASSGQFEVLLWLRANGCPWNTQARQMAAKLGYVEPEGPDESDAWDNELLGYLDWYHTK